MDKQKAVRKEKEGAFVDLLNQEMRELQESQKQIEEMARVIAFDLCPNRHIHAKWGEEAQCYSDNNFAECTKIKNAVDKLYNAGYRKVCEPAIKNGEVVGFVNGADYVPKNLFLFGLSQARKETAEKFAERLKEKASMSFTAMSNGIKVGDTSYQISERKIDEIAKEIIGERE